MKTKEGSGWKAWNDEDNERYFGEYGGIQSYSLYELSRQQYEQLDSAICSRRLRRTAARTP